MYVGASLVCEVRRREDGSMGTCDFEGGVDMPCNGAARATAFVGLALLVWGLWS